MKISGHRTREIFDRYDITSDRDLREAMLKTDSYLESLPSKPTLEPLRRGQLAIRKPNTDRTRTNASFGRVFSFCKSLGNMVRPPRFERGTFSSGG